MVTVTLALAAAAAYGSADFFGGLASRRMAAAAVVALSQIAGLLVLAAAFPLLPGAFYASDLGWGLAAGLGGAVGIAALYAALAAGRMGLVSPVSAVVGASVPVVWGLVAGERPGGAALSGIAMAFVAVALISTDAQTGRISRLEPGLGLALLSGLAIGALYVCLAQARHDAGLAVLVASRLASICLLVAYAAVRRESLGAGTAVWPALALTGALDMGANILYLLAARAGLVSVAAVLTSLYPGATVFWARLVLHERLSPVQWTGVACAAGAIILISVR